MDRLTQRIDMGDNDFDEIAFKNPHDPEGLYNLRDIALVLNNDELLPIAEKLAAYEDAEAEGRLIVLPCMVGDTIWRFDSSKNIYDQYKIVELVKDGFRIGTQFIKWEDFGKTVFLTREEAEAALKEGKS